MMNVIPKEAGVGADLLGGREMESQGQAGIRTCSGNCRRGGERETKGRGKMDRTKDFGGHKSSEDGGVKNKCKFSSLAGLKKYPLCWLGLYLTLSIRHTNQQWLLHNRHLFLHRL